ncbi:MAG: CsiV family protein [Pseudomonadota bacterium]
MGNYYGVSRLKQTIQFFYCIAVAVVIGGLSSGRARAADGDVDKWYEVELILFAHPDGNALQSEHWVSDPGLPPSDKSVERLTRPAPPPAANPAAATAAPPKNVPVAFQMLPPNDMKLSPLVEKLTASAGYKVLMHTAWRQPVSKGERGSGVMLDNTVDANYSPPSATPPAVVGTALAPEVSPFIGVFALTSTRYLHVTVDILYRQPDVVRAASVIDNTTPTFSMGVDSGIPTTAVNNPIAGFRMTDLRKIKTDQLHYFDHPLFGVIARVVPVDIGKGGKNP